MGFLFLPAYLFKKRDKRKKKRNLHSYSNPLPSVPTLPSFKRTRKTITGQINKPALFGVSRLYAASAIHPFDKVPIKCLKFLQENNHVLFASPFALSANHGSLYTAS